MKITMYELLGMVKDGKAPKKIKYINSIWEYDKETKDYFNDDLWLIYSMNSIGLTERKVEIIEEDKKIEKLERFDIQGLETSGYSMTQAEYLLEDGIKENRNKINEIIDYINNKD